MATFLESTTTDLHYPGLTGSDGRMLNRYVASDGTKYYKEADLEEVLMDYELEDLKSITSPVSIDPKIVV